MTKPILTRTNCILCRMANCNVCHHPMYKNTTPPPPPSPPPLPKRKKKDYLQFKTCIRIAQNMAPPKIQVWGKVKNPSGRPIQEYIRGNWNVGGRVAWPIIVRRKQVFFPSEIAEYGIFPLLFWYHRNCAWIKEKFLLATWLLMRVRST